MQQIKKERNKKMTNINTFIKTLGARNLIIKSQKFQAT